MEDKVSVAVADEDMGDGMHCTDHPHRTNPGGICAFCLQEKLGKLVSSSFPLPLAASSSSSSSPSFRSTNAAASSAASALAPSSSSSASTTAYTDHRRARIPFLLAKKKKKVVMVTAAAAAATLPDRGSSSSSSAAVFKRSKSTSAAASRVHFMDGGGDDDYSPRKRGGFWSFLQFSHSRPASKVQAASVAAAASSSRGGIAEEEPEESPNSRATVPSAASSFERKVSRSRSVGCGSRSFSGDFFERISTGFGDCTLRRVESQREGKPKPSAHRGGGDHHCTMKERVKCGGIFGGFIMTSSSSSSSSSSYWVSSAADDMIGKSGGAIGNGRSRSWGWAFASPMRAFTKPSGKDAKRDIIRQASDKNATPNLAAIPSLLAARG